MTDDVSTIPTVVNEIGTTDHFGNAYIIGRVIPKFPYPTRRCPYCNCKLIIANAVHYSPAPEHYKAVFIDGNINCSVYNEGAKQCYAKVYYSSEEAAARFYNVKFPVRRWGQKELYTIYK
jgi:hypothetical protein|tara:strand:+ start:6013 stop:6372 length:360 start_codon:yes stop_codon:yes gene_type:complete